MWARILLTALLFSLSLGLSWGASAGDDDDFEITDPENTLVMELETGRAFIEMRPDLAPNHVRRIKELVREGFYDGLTFHRVIPGFMAQGGDPTGDGSGGTGQNIDAEFSDVPHRRGTVSMARTDDPNSADSQFFVVIGEEVPELDGKYTVWGQVIHGMKSVMRVRKGSRALDGRVFKPTKILSIVVAADDSDERKD